MIGDLRLAGHLTSYEKIPNLFLNIYLIMLR